MGFNSGFKGLKSAHHFYNLLWQQHGERANFCMLAKLVWHSVTAADIWCGST